MKLKRMFLKVQTTLAVSLIITLIFTPVVVADPVEVADNIAEASIWYIGNGSDSDASAAKTKLSSSPYSWTINHYKSSKNAGSEPSAYDLYNNSDYSDLVYISGHGYENHTRFPLYKADNSISTWLYVSEKWAGSYKYIGAEWKEGSTTKSTSKWNGDLEWAVICACNQLNLSSDEASSAREWARVLCGDPVRMHSIIGYTGLAPGDGVDTTITNEFFNYANKNNGYTIIDAWKKANNNHQANWATVYHYANKPDHFHGQGSVTGDTDPNSTPNIKYLKVGSSETPVYPKSSSVIENLYSQPYYKQLQISATPVRVLQNKHTTIEVKTGIPPAPPELPPLLIKKQAVNVSELAKSLIGEEKYNNAFSFSEDGRNVYRINNSHLEIFPTGGFNYDYDIDEHEFTPVNFGPKKAEERAKKFLTNMGININELILKNVRPIQETTLNLTGKSNDITVTIAYKVEFTRKTNDLILANGDGVRIVLDNNGVKEYSNGIRAIEGFGKPQTLISIEKVFQEMEDNLHLAFALPEKEEITDIKLVYYVSNKAKPQDIIHPAWAFELDKNNYAYVDAFTGKILLDY